MPVSAVAAAAEEEEEDDDDDDDDDDDEYDYDDDEDEDAPSVSSSDANIEVVRAASDSSDNDNDDNEEEEEETIGGGTEDEDEDEVVRGDALLSLLHQSSSPRRLPSVLGRRPRATSAEEQAFQEAMASVDRRGAGLFSTDNREGGRQHMSRGRRTRGTW